MAEVEDVESDKSTRKSRKCKFSRQVLVKDEIRARSKQIRDILKKQEDDRTLEELDTLQESPEVVKAIQKRVKVQHAQKQRVLEIEDEPDVLKTKCLQLAAAIRASEKVVIYTGAGISTAASIPDYRGPNGVWTLLKQGKELTAQDLCDAEPTYTHMGIVKLYREGHLKHVVSQNCDGLHIRSGLPRQILSEVHGNMFIEQCKECKPNREYVRLFDVTESTGVRRHKTGRKCHRCNGLLQDTIVHFGEKGGLKSPYRWKEAVKAANNSDLILCLGSSLKLLKKYSCLWCMDRRVQKRPKLYIVNLQWTPKDDSATLKINGRCDDVIQQIMSCLGYDVPIYKRELDPIFSLSTPLRKKEFKTTSKKILEIPSGYVKPSKTQRKPSQKVKIDSESKPEYSAIKSILSSSLPAGEGSVPYNITCDRLDGKITGSTMQDSVKCIQLLSGSVSPLLPPFQDTVLASRVLGAHDLKLVTGLMSQIPSGHPGTSQHPPQVHDIPRLPGSVILDHCYCKQINCRGQCRTSPEKSDSPRLSGGVYREQDEAMDLSRLPTQDQPLDLSPRTKAVQSAVIPVHVVKHEPSVRRFDESRPPGLVLAASLHGVNLPKLETFADLQQYCMMGLPSSLKAPVHGLVTLSHSNSGQSTSSHVHTVKQETTSTVIQTLRTEAEEQRESDVSSPASESVSSASETLSKEETDVEKTSSESSNEDLIEDRTTSRESSSEPVNQEEGKSETKSAPRTKKRLTSASIPGWFGKGLNTKKRRRF